MKYILILIILCIIHESVHAQSNIEITNRSDLTNKQIDEALYKSLFCLDKNVRVRYKISIKWEPNKDLAKIIKNNIAKNKNNAAAQSNSSLFIQQSKQVEDGYIDNRIIEITSDKGSLLISDKSLNNWNNNNFIEYFYTATSTTIQNHLSKTIEVYPPSKEVYPELNCFFPQITSLSGQKMNILSLILDKNKCEIKFNYTIDGNPFLFVDSIDCKKSEITSNIYTLKGTVKRATKLNFSKFDLYHVNWPNNISSQVFNTDSSRLLYNETWELVEATFYENSNNIIPQIDSSYHIIDKTGLNVPNSELQKILSN
jgi:hypothetical protein